MGYLHAKASGNVAEEALKLNHKLYQWCPKCLHRDVIVQTVMRHTNEGPAGG